MTYLQILNLIKETALAQPNVNTVVREFIDLNREDTKYSAVVIQDRDGTRDRISEQDYITYTWHLGYVDRLTYDESNRDDIFSTGMNVITNIMNSIRDSYFPILEVRIIDRFNTFNQRFTASCAGVYVVLAIDVAVSDCVDGEQLDMYDKYEARITENGSYHFIPDGRPVNDIEITVEVSGTSKPEETLTETITSNGSYHYDPTPGSVFSDADITVDVHPSESLSETYTTNGTKTITGEFKDGTVNVDVHPSVSLSETYASNGVYSISGEFNGGSVTVSVPSDQKPEERLVETIISNGNYNYDPTPGSVFSGADISVNVHPSASLSESYTSNGIYTVSGEFNGGTVAVSVPVPVSSTLSETITSNGSYSYSAPSGYTYDTVAMSVDVHPSVSYSGVFTSNGTTAISGEFNGGQVTVSVPEVSLSSLSVSLSNNGSYSYTAPSGQAYDTVAVEVSVVNNTVTLTQSAYDALSVKDPDTIYLIYG